ncbi:MAG: HAD family hydrolase [Demequina sp.]|jgi:hydroxymethylpyrimidine pyrophosphatase-like HAD family hydrolase|nr:HAD family hydrolase [Demequina sp.]
MNREDQNELAATDWRLVGLDIDGTLMNYGGEISQAVIDMVEKVRMCRTHVVLATGRNIVATLPVAHALGIRRGWAVCSNGAVTIRLNPGTPGGYDLAHVRTFDPRAALEIVRQELPDAFVAVEDLGVGFRVAKEFPMGELSGRQITVDFDDLWREPATRVVVRAPGVDVEHFDAVVRAMGLQDVTYAIGYTAWLDLTGPGVSKGSALEELRVQLGVDAAHTVAVGDGTNDVEMLRWAARSAAMGNAPEKLKAVADEVLGLVADDAVVPFLAQLADPTRLALL